MIRKNLLPNVVLVITDSRGKILYLNTTGEEILGFSTLPSGDFYFWDLFKSDPPVKDPKDVFSRVNSLAKRPGEFHLKTRVPEFLDWKFTAVKNGKEELFVGHGVFEQLDIPGELSMLNNVFYHTRLGVAIGGPEGKTLDLINPAFAEMHGFSMAELIGKSIETVFAPEEQKNIQEEVKKVHQKGWHRFFTRHQRKNGSVFPVLVDAVAIKNNRGMVQYRVVNVIDITEEERSERYRKNQIEIMSSLESYSSLEEKINFILRSILELVNGERGFFCLKGSEEYLVSNRGLEELPPERFIDLWEKKSREGAARDFGTVFIPRPDSSLGWLNKAWEGDSSGGPFLLIPLKPGEEILGLLFLGFDSLDRFDAEEIPYLEGLLRPIGYAMKNAIAQDELLASNAKYRLLFENANDGIMLMDGMFFSDCNQKIMEMFRATSRDIIGKTPIEISPARQPDGSDSEKKSREKVEKALQGEPQFFQWQHRKLDGELFDVEVSLNSVIIGGEVYLQSIVRDITERKRTEERLRYLSFHDSLTGIYNRAFFEEMLGKMDLEKNYPLSVIMGDINGLKMINDAFGHREGDRVLREIAQLIKKTVREEDIVCRWGGDEFAVLLPRTGLEKALEITQKIKSGGKEILTRNLPSSISLGVATKDRGEENLEGILHRAEERMARNKFLETMSGRSALITALQKTLFEKSNETEEHAQRMENMARALGREMGLDDSKIDELALLATLHDLGKIGIPEEIVKKPGPLTSKEWEIVKRHPEIGFRIAEGTPELAPIAWGILTHHERWDGKGYPRGLKKRDIPLISRIVAIIDAYDVMTNGRPYKEAISHREALLELKENAGTQFDSEIVNTFVKIMENRRGFSGFC